MAALSPASPNHKQTNRNRFSNISTTPKSWNKSVNSLNNNNRLVETSLVSDFNKNVTETSKTTRSSPKSSSYKIEKCTLKQSFPKLLCLKKSTNSSNENTFKTLNVNTLGTENLSWDDYYNVNGNASKSLDSLRSNRNGGGYDKSEDASPSSSKHIECLSNPNKNRKSFHQNVEDALSSLLWQPYEYQTKTSATSMTSSSCSTLSSFNDLDEITKNDDTSPCCSFTDLHLLTSTSEMVIKLPSDEATDQSTQRSKSHDVHTLRSNSWLSDVFSLTEVQCRRVTSGETSLSDDNSCSDMQVNVSLNGPSVPQTSILNITTSENGLRNNVTVQNQHNLLTSNSLNLSSANVVGLPNHARYASVPVSTIQNNRPAGSNAVFPNHARHISEPSANFLKAYNQNSMASLQPGSMPSNQHARYSAQLDQNNYHQINHTRSSSVPRSIPLVPRHDTSTTTTTTTTVPSQHANNFKFTQKVNSQIDNNISNVNVNCCRPITASTVSAVPTIQCLNTLSNIQGNEVSNVQVLPLGSNNIPSNSQQLSINTTPINSSYNSNTTQVILHNTPQTSNNICTGTTNYIHIPNWNQNITRNSLFDLQVVQNRNNTASTSSAITHFLPPPPITSFNNQVVIQNTKPISSTMVQMPYNQSKTIVRPLLNNATNTVQLHNITVQNSVQQLSQSKSETNTESRTTARTFTSTEAQTDDISVLPPSSESTPAIREQRRRERRERRHQRRPTGGSTQRQSIESSTQVNNLQNDRLPDILNSHLPPPYSTLPNVVSRPQSVIGPPMPPPMISAPQMLPPPPPGAVLQTVVPNNLVPPSGFVFQAPPPVVPGQVPLVQRAPPVAVPVPPPSGFRFPFPTNGFRRGRFSEDPPKGCCGLLTWKPGSLRWFIALIALVAVCCVLVGTALGAMRPAGRDHLTVSLLMIGVGIVLVTVSGVAWRLTSHDSSTCRSMLGLGSTESVDVCSRRFVPRLPPSYGRPHHPYAAMMYPEFQYRPPPPSYQASMQEYRLRLLLLDRGNTPQIQAGIQNAISPPPTYRSHAGSLLRAPLSSRREAAHSEYSFPPSYRSQNSMNRQGTLQSNSVLHSREHSLSLSESNNGGSVVNVVNILGSTAEDVALDNITLDSLKMEPESDNPVKMLLKSNSSDLEGSKDGNLVTIVQTSDQSPVIVTVSGSSQIDNNSSVHIVEVPSEMEILAHL